MPYYAETGRSRPPKRFWAYVPKKFTNACKSRPFPGVMNKSVEIGELGLHPDGRRRSLQFMKSLFLEGR